MRYGAHEKRLLVEGLGVAIGEWIFAMNGPFLFNRFGLAVPEAATVGCLVGAALGYGCTRALIRLQTRKQGTSTVLRVSGHETRRTARGVARLLGKHA